MTIKKKKRKVVFKKCANVSVKAITPSQSYNFPDLSEFRKSIHIKGEPLSQTVIKGRG